MNAMQQVYSSRKKIYLGNAMEFNIRARALLQHVSTKHGQTNSLFCPANEEISSSGEHTSDYVQK